MTENTWKKPKDIEGELQWKHGLMWKDVYFKISTNTIYLSPRSRKCNNRILHSISLTEVDEISEIGTKFSKRCFKIILKTGAIEQFKCPAHMDTIKVKQWIENLRHAQQFWKDKENLQLKKPGRPRRVTLEDPDEASESLNVTKHRVFFTLWNGEMKGLLVDSTSTFTDVYSRLFTFGCETSSCSVCKIRHQSCDLWAVDTSGTARRVKKDEILMDLSKAGNCFFVMEHHQKVMVVHFSDFSYEALPVPPRITTKQVLSLDQVALKLNELSCFDPGLFLRYENGKEVQFCMNDIPLLYQEYGKIIARSKRVRLNSLKKSDYEMIAKIRWTEYENYLKRKKTSQSVGDHLVDKIKKTSRVDEELCFVDDHFALNNEESRISASSYPREMQVQRHLIRLDLPKPCEGNDNDESDTDKTSHGNDGREDGEDGDDNDDSDGDEGNGDDNNGNSFKDNGDASIASISSSSEENIEQKAPSGLVNITTDNNVILESSDRKYPSNNANVLNISTEENVSDNDEKTMHQDENFTKNNNDTKVTSHPCSDADTTGTKNNNDDIVLPGDDHVINISRDSGKMASYAINNNEEKEDGVENNNKVDDQTFLNHENSSSTEVIADEKDVKYPRSNSNDFPNSKGISDSFPDPKENDQANFTFKINNKRLTHSESDGFVFQTQRDKFLYSDDHSPKSRISMRRSLSDLNVRYSFTIGETRDNPAESHDTQLVSRDTRAMSDPLILDEKDDDDVRVEDLYPVTLEITSSFESSEDNSISDLSTFTGPTWTFAKGVEECVRKILTVKSHRKQVEKIISEDLCKVLYELLEHGLKKNFLGISLFSIGSNVWSICQIVCETTSIGVEIIKKIKEGSIVEKFRMFIRECIRHKVLSQWFEMLSTENVQKLMKKYYDTSAVVLEPEHSKAMEHMKLYLDGLVVLQLKELKVRGSLNQNSDLLISFE